MNTAAIDAARTSTDEQADLFIYDYSRDFYATTAAERVARGGSFPHVVRVIATGVERRTESWSTRKDGVEHTRVFVSRKDGVLAYDDGRSPFKSVDPSARIKMPFGDFLALVAAADEQYAAEVAEKEAAEAARNQFTTLLSGTFEDADVTALVVAHLGANPAEDLATAGEWTVELVGDDLYAAERTTTDNYGRPFTYRVGLSKMGKAHRTLFGMEAPYSHRSTHKSAGDWVVHARSVPDIAAALFAIATQGGL